jgi:hypothetical protein
MLVTEKTEKDKKNHKTTARRSHLKLSLEERRRQLAEQADKLASHYENTKKERETWQGGDLVEF